jgi:hypothetical protein
MSDWITERQEAERQMQALFTQAAAALLAPRAVKVRFQSPALEGASGMVSRDEAGTYVIDISPYGRTWDGMYGILLHEVGHVLDTSHEIRKSSYHRLAPDSEKRENMVISSTEKAARPRLESKADQIAAELERYAEMKAYDYLRYGETALHAKLRALISNPPTKKR